jgi:hypothetical protein
MTGTLNHAQPTSSSNSYWPHFVPKVRIVLRVSDTVCLDYDETGWTLDLWSGIHLHDFANKDKDHEELETQSVFGECYQI